MTKISSTPPSGFRDFTPAESAARQELLQSIANCYRAHGFERIEISALENLSTLQGKGGGGDNEKLIFKVLKRGEQLEKALAQNAELADMGMRFDLTLPLARYCANHQAEIPRPFKVFQMGSVWRADRPQKGRYREFVQCDVDILGAKEIGAEVEVLSAILSVFQKFALPVELHLNDRRLLLAWGKSLGVEEAKWPEVLVVLDKLDKLGASGVCQELAEKNLLDPKQVEKFAEALEKAELADLSAFAAIDPESAASLKEILEILTTNFPKESGIRLRFNPSLVRGQDYYTGTIFEIRHPELSGSIGGGGRYNRLLELFGTQDTPAFGGSIGFERLVLLLQEQKKLSDKNSAPQVFFPLFAPSLRGRIFALAQELRLKGIRADVFPDAAKLKNQFKYADDRKIPFVASLGEEELNKGIIKLKNMSTREEKEVALKDFVKTLETLCKA